MEFNGVALAVIRNLSGLSQSELGRLAGVSQGHISQLESGDKKPRPAMVKRLADTLGVPISAFVSPRVLEDVVADLGPSGDGDEPGALHPPEGDALEPTDC